VLVDMGADTTAVDARGRTPLDVAREKGYVSNRLVFLTVFREFRCMFFKTLTG
jgi:hypothetical protein